MKSKRHKKSGHPMTGTHNIAGKLVTLIQLAVSVICIVLIWNSGLAPVKYMVPLIIVLLVLFAATHALQYPRNKVVRYVGMIISLLMTIVLAVGSVALMKTDDVLQKIGGATYKTDNMVVVVKKDDKAENISDAQNYRFGYQTVVDQDNTEKMVKDVTNVIGRDLKAETYESLTDEANALLNGNIDAAIFNEGYMSMIDDSIEGFSDQVKILYQYGIKTEIKQEKQADVSEPFNVFISGIDVAGPITTNSRSDVNIIMTVNPQTRKILLSTTPRDYYVTIPNVSGEQRDKLTHAGIYGVDASMNTLESLYGIDISYYARVNFTSLETIVDALGGVDVNSEVEFTAQGYSFTKGMNHMDGKQALAFSRERYSFQEGDNQRGKDQEAVLTAIINKATSPAILKSANEILASVSDCVETNMTQDEMAKFINMQLNDGGSWNVESQAASGTGDTQACYSSGSQPLYVMWPDENVVTEVSNKINAVMQ
ncbi:LCP family glycopolymer transferase [Dorea sp.]